MYLVPVVRKVDNAIHRINHYPEDSITIPRIVIYPLDNAIQPLNNRGLDWIVMYLVDNVIHPLTGLASKGMFLGEMWKKNHVQKYY